MICLIVFRRPNGGIGDSSGRGRTAKWCEIRTSVSPNKELYRRRASKYYANVRLISTFPIAAYAQASLSLLQTPLTLSREGLFPMFQLDARKIHQKGKKILNDNLLDDSVGGNFKKRRRCSVENLMAIVTLMASSLRRLLSAGIEPVRTRTFLTGNTTDLANGLC